jgi:tRNA(Arg) A34 adenosine deaminase TadA
MIKKKRRQKKHQLTATVFDKKGNVLSIAGNSFSKTHPEQKRLAYRCGLHHKIFLHAEIAALIKVRNGTPYKIKVERYDNCGNPVLAKPCPICELAIKEAGIKFVEYTM